MRKHLVLDRLKSEFLSLDWKDRSTNSYVMFKAYDGDFAVVVNGPKNATYCTLRIILDEGCSTELVTGFKFANWKALFQERLKQSNEEKDRRALRYLKTLQ